MLVASRLGCALLALAVSSVAACTKEEVPLGTFGEGGNAGAAGSGGTDPGSVWSCADTGTPGPLSVAGDTTGITLTYTDWAWPTPLDSLEWDLMVESDFQRDGYFWAHQFDFVGSPGGFLGLQSRGGYQADPPDGPVETTNMVVFWISSSPLGAELGDVAYPNARTYFKSEAGGQWWTIHARYAFEACRVYRLRVARHSTDGAGNIWYGAWIRDTVTNLETFVGRILVRASWGQLAAASSMFSNRIGYAALTSCESPEPASARFGVPSANGGGVRPSSHTNRFADPRQCPTSRFTELAGSVRHEIGLMP